MIKTIFLDMDGVLVDFNKAVCDKFHLPYPPQTYEFFPEIRLQVNNICTATFWNNLEWMYDGCDILQAVLDKIHLSRIYLLTTPMLNLESASGKMMWIDGNLPEFIKRIIITQAPKRLLARPDTLLIDDKDENIDEFIEAGGHGILVPRPWNELHGWADEALQVVKNSLEEII